jgi:small subunit ribosomal protein S16
MLKIKLSPVGKKHDRQYRIVVMEEHSKITGTTIADLGFYNPKSKKVDIEHTEVTKWLKNGAQPTPTVRDLLKLS